MRNLWSVFCLCLVSCISVREGNFRATDVGASTKIVGLAFANGTEAAPPGASVDAVLDEFEIAERNVNQVCVHFLIRTDESLDLPPSEWSVELNGKRAVPRETTVQAVSYSFEGTRTVVSAFGSFNGDFGTLRISLPETRVSIVAERAGQVCGQPGPDANVVKIDVVSPGRFMHAIQWNFN